MLRDKNGMPTTVIASLRARVSELEAELQDEADICDRFAAELAAEREKVKNWDEAWGEARRAVVGEIVNPNLGAKVLDIFLRLDPRNKED
jgi:FtsZ-binding cell division protein ZapB